MLTTTMRLGDICRTGNQAGCKPDSKMQISVGGGGYNTSASGLSSSRVRDQRREILRAASNKLRNEPSSEQLYGGCSNWGKVPEDEQISNGSKFEHRLPVSADEKKGSTVSNNIMSPLSILSETSDYTMSSVSTDERVPELVSETSQNSINGRLDQWNVIDDVDSSIGLLDHDDALHNKKNRGSCEESGLLETSDHHTTSCNVANLPRKTCGTNIKLGEEMFLPLEYLSNDEIPCKGKDDFDIVYDVFYHDEDETFEELVVTEDLRNAAGADFEEAVDTNPGTPLLERVDSPELSTRSARSLPGKSTCRSVEEDFITFSSQNFRRVPGALVYDASHEDDSLSFSRRDLGVLRQSLRELRLGVSIQDNNLTYGDAEDIQEDLSLSSRIVPETKDHLLEHLEKDDRNKSFSNCQEMLSHHERKVRPLSAVLLKPLCSTCLPWSHHSNATVKSEHCTQHIRSTEMAPNKVFQASPFTDNSIDDTFLEQKEEVKSGTSENSVSHMIDYGSNTKSDDSSYATPRTGISADELEFSLSRKIVPSKSEVKEDTEGSVLELLSAKVQLLDVTQQKYLLQVLDKIERAKKSGSVSVPSLLASLERPWNGVPLATPEVKADPKTHLIVLRILSTWGDTKNVGLVEVDLFDKKDRKLELQRSALSLHGNIFMDIYSNENLSRIINGVVNTTRDRHMWLCPLPSPKDAPLEIHIRVPSSDVVLGHMKVWNYNKSIREIVKGVKEVQVHVDGELVWQGVIAKGCGNQVFDYSTKIPLLEETPLSETATTAHLPASCYKMALDENHFVAKTPEACCEFQRKENPGCPPISVGTSFTFSPIEASSSSSVCGILSCTSSTSGHEEMHPTTALLSEEKTPDPVDVNNFTDDCSAARIISLDLRASRFTPSPDRKNDDNRFGESLERKTLHRDSLPIWLQGSSVIVEDASKIEQSPSITVAEAGDRSLASDTHTGNESEESIPLDVDDPHQSSRNKSASSECGVQESEASSNIGSPRKQRLLHSAFAGLRKMVVRFKLGLRLASREGDAQRKDVPTGSPGDNHSLTTAPHASRNNSWKENDPPGLGSCGLFPSSQSVEEYEAAKRQAEEECIEHFETPGVTELRNELLDSWDSLMHFKAAKMADAQLFSSIMSCQKLYRTATNSAQYFAICSDTSNSIPSSPSLQPEGMTIPAQTQLESLGCRVGTNSPRNPMPLGNDFLWSIDSGSRLFKEMSELDFSGDDEDMFTIPVLPHGQVLIVNILSTWGDPHYVGLVGIELFDGSGRLIEINDPFEQVQANPPDINILPGYTDDPRTVDKLVDNVNMTCDDYHVWLAPFTPGQPHYINITLNSPTTLGMIRFWNYNKSRIHSFRGARTVKITLDQELIFAGEVRKASGSLIDAAERTEPILFTEDEAALMAIDIYDQRYHKETEVVLARESATSTVQRPDTAGRRTGDHSTSIDTQHLPAEVIESACRPPTHARRIKANYVFPMTSTTSADVMENSHLQRVLMLWKCQEISEANHTRKQQEKCLVGQVLQLQLLGTWGDPHYAGLTGIEVLNSNGVRHSLTPGCMIARPRDLNDIPGCKGDHRTLDKLVDGCDVTTNDHHMWLIPFNGVHSEHWLRIDFGKTVPISAIKIWNYNKNLDDTCRGVKWIQVLVDDMEIFPSGAELVRKAPGTDIFDFGYLLPLNRSSQQTGRTLSQLDLINFRERAMQKRNHNEFLRQEFETPLLPCGHIVKFSLLSTWGDQHYMGLNGIELYDEAGRLLAMSKYSVHASPSSINDLPGVVDIRTLDKLVDGENNTWDDQHMWLTIYDLGKSNQIYFMFESPVMVSVVRIWNYSKTPTRGVREFELDMEEVEGFHWLPNIVQLSIDDLLIYKGCLRPAPPRTSLDFSSNDLLDFSQSIIFTNDEGLLRDHRSRVYYRGDVEHTDVVLINEKRIQSSAKPSIFSVLEYRKRPRTGLSDLQSK